MLAPGLVQAGLIFLRHGQISISYTHKSLCCNSQQAISHVARDRNDAIDMQVHLSESNVAPRSRQLQSNCLVKVCKRFKKNLEATKKSGAYAFPAAEVRASMPTSRKKIVAQRSVQHSARLAE
jgi:hypothetical protein